MHNRLICCSLKPLAAPYSQAGDKLEYDLSIDSETMCTGAQPSVGGFIFLCNKFCLLKSRQTQSFVLMYGL